MANRKIILAVDDMPENLTLVRSMLKDYFDVRLAKSAKLALGLLDGLQVDLILLDIEMPGMSGFEFLRRIIEGKESLNKKTPVIFVTSHAEVDFIDRAINSGAKDYILKPIKAEALLKKVGALIGLPKDKTDPIFGELERLITAIESGDTSSSDSLLREIAAAGASESDFTRSCIQEITQMVQAFDSEAAVVKIQNLMHNLSLDRKKAEMKAEMKAEDAGHA